ncbi:hypothetical protein [Kitasatospora kifunensis]|uniref:Phage baseplate assembly protein gpV n=1 Tax=Kitasatospora kifunensis TaxID=58351 RepID=A0A7W7R8R5_KITKI|nr:hypothetical protein [Kitasatospora kifunensis]MBB4927379.1 phage baseplate assembly protein gpV [Kitasatospora kifunensis]
MESTAETNLIKPARGTLPSPLRVSTMDELEYGTVVLRFGRDLPTAVSKVYCKGITVTVPTGRSGADLTIEPSLITTAVSKVNGEAQGWEWNVDSDTTDPNKAVFSFVPDTTAVFDGEWAVSLTLSGIEVNPSIGTVDLDIEETTSTTGEEDSYQKRNGKVEVKKGNDEFFFRSLHPRTVVINRGSTVDLLWEAPADNRITYTMYYRRADGTETSDSVQANFKDGVWKSPALDDNANFTLKATLDGQDYFLTTSLTVNNPNVVVNTLKANSNVTVEATGTLTTNGPIEAKGNVTVDPGAAGYIWLKTGRFDTAAAATVNLFGALNAKAALTVDGTLTANGALNANGNVTVDPGATGYIWLKTGRFDTTAEANLNLFGALNANGGLNMGAGKNITIPQGGGELVVADAFVAKSHKPNVSYPKVEIGAAGVATDGGITLRGVISATGMTASGKRVVRNGDRIELQNNVSGTPNFLYHASNASQWDNVVARPSNIFENSVWYVVSEAGNIASNDGGDPSEPNRSAAPDTAGPGTPSA